MVNILYCPICKKQFYNPQERQSHVIIKHQLFININDEVHKNDETETSIQNRSMYAID